MAAETFSQVEKYEALATKLGATAEHIESARFQGEFTLAAGDTLGKKLLDQYGNNAEGKKKMASMLVQIAKAGFNVDYVKAGEKLTFDGPTFTVTKHNGEKLVYNLDQPRQEVADQTRNSIEGLSRDAAASLALDICNLYLTAQSGGGVEDWEGEKEYFIKGVIEFATTEDAADLGFAAEVEKISAAEAAHGKGSAEYNLAIISCLKAIRDKFDASKMTDMWDWLTAYVDNKGEKPEPKYEDVEKTDEREYVGKGPCEKHGREERARIATAMESYFDGMEAKQAMTYAKQVTIDWDKEGKGKDRVRFVEVKWQEATGKDVPAAGLETKTIKATIDMKFGTTWKGQWDELEAAFMTKLEEVKR